MITEILQVLIAIILLIALIFALLHFVKYRKTNAEMIADLFNKCCREDREEKENMCRKRRF